MFLYPGSGKGTVGKPIQIGHGWAKLNVIPSADLTGDGINDMLAIDTRTGVLLLYSGNGKGGFKTGKKQVGHGWKGLTLVAGADINGDRIADIVSRTKTGTLNLYKGKGVGTFQPPLQIATGD